MIQINFTINIKSTIHSLTQSLDVILMKKSETELALNWQKTHWHVSWRRRGSPAHPRPMRNFLKTFFVLFFAFFLTLISWFWLKSRNPEIKVPSTPPATAKIWKWKNLKLFILCHSDACSLFIFCLVLNKWLEAEVTELQRILTGLQNPLFSWYCFLLTVC